MNMRPLRKHASLEPYSVSRTSGRCVMAFGTRESSGSKSSGCLMARLASHHTEGGCAGRLKSAECIVSRAELFSGVCSEYLETCRFNQFSRQCPILYQRIRPLTVSVVLVCFACACDDHFMIAGYDFGIHSIACFGLDCQ